MTLDFILQHMPEQLYFELPTDKWDMEIPENSPLNYEIETAFYKWNTNKAVVIIVWKWWTTQWYQNKYVTISNNLVDKHWVNVFVVENPWISRDDPELFFDCAIKFVRDKMKELWYNNLDLTVIWFSAWWHFTWRFSYKYPEIKEILCSIKELKDELKNSFENKVTIIQWKRDTDYPFNPLLSQIPKAKVVVLEWVDHQFSNEWGLDLFISLPENYLSFS